ncbi:hypothetical protein K2173_006083 [Erythroxylum novogranatense]|uniref:DUF632 domain-containing protein n=1 Tax=Erythroxylum novogranatense TaxID=1862640 RepID=A0AAV8TDY7_9ROSI|nr:hypothetical protein K2173_006083 [Erythroxylum novogranatense]
MGCGLSKQNEADDVVSLCRERKRLLKLAVEKRYGFADGHRMYNQSLHEMATALRLFVARQSSSSSPFLITFPSSSVTDYPNMTPISKPTFLLQRPPEPVKLTTACQPTEFEETSDASRLETQEEEEVLEVDEKEEDSESEDVEKLCNHFYGDEVQAMPMPSPQRGFGWDFFNPFDEMTTKEVNCFSQSCDEDLMAVREKEGVPELEKDIERVTNESEVVHEQNGDVGQNQNMADTKISGDFVDTRLAESKGLRTIDVAANGRELLKALKDVEDHFIRAYDSGFEISRMLEANRVQLNSGLEEIKENSNKLIQSITWNRSASSRSSSRRSLLTSYSTNSSGWTDFKNDLFDYYGMEAGNHALTLERLFAWEKKLYEEVKTGEEARKNYVRKFSKDKHSADVNDLHARITVGIRTVESISNRIRKLRDEELQPQLIELLHGLMRSWKTMSESHQSQNRVMLDVTSFSPHYGKFCNDSHRRATIQLEAAIDNWHSCFATYVSTQKAYIEALFCWLCKFIAPEDELFYRSKFSMPSTQFRGPPLLVTCHKWFVCLQSLPDKAVTYAMKNLGKNIHVLGNQQGEEQQQKRKVDRLAKEIDKRVLVFQREERRILESKLSDQLPESSVRKGIDYLAERKNQLDMFRKSLDAEKVKHLTSMQETQQVTIHGIQTGLSSVFETLIEFSEASTLMYTNLITQNANAKTLDENDMNVSRIGDFVF